MLNYTKLWILLENKGMKRTDLKQVISANTLAKLGKNEIVSSAVIEKICGFLKCQPGDIMEYIDEEQLSELSKEIEKVNKIIVEQMKAQGISEEQFATMMSQVMNESIKSMFNGGPSLEEISDIIIEANIKKDQ